MRKFLIRAALLEGNPLLLLFGVPVFIGFCQSLNSERHLSFSVADQICQKIAKDMILVFSVGGGNREHNISMNLVRSLEYAHEVGAGICGVVGRDGGYTAQVANACVVVPTVNSSTVTPHVESFQALLWHLLVSHPELQAAAMKWESVK